MGVRAELGWNEVDRDSTKLLRYGIVPREKTNFLLTNFIVPSQDEEANVSFFKFDQSTENTSRVCSCQARMGKSWKG